MKLDDAIRQLNYMRHRTDVIEKSDAEALDYVIAKLRREQSKRKKILKMKATEYQHKWYEEHKEARRAYKKEYYIANRERLSALNKKWRDEHKEYTKQKNAEYRRKKKDGDAESV